MTYLTYIWSIISDLFSMFFTTTAGNPFPVLVVLVVVSFIGIFFIKKVLR